MENDSHEKLKLDESDIQQETNDFELNNFDSSNNNKLSDFQYQTSSSNFKQQIHHDENSSILQNQQSDKPQFFPQKLVQFESASLTKVQSNIKHENLVSQNWLIALQTLQKMVNQVKKDYFRQFCKDLTSWYIQSLKDQNRKIRDTKFIEQAKIRQQNWPFKDLYYKINKNQNDKIMLEFVNMCAQKIQTTFKGYITRKRHVIASEKLKIFKNKFGAVLKGWKTWNIFNCKKVKSIRQTVAALQKQQQHQIQHSNLDKRLKLKKIQYLKSNIQINIVLFKGMFKQLYEKGTWIFEVQKCFKPYKHKGPHHSEHSYYPTQFKTHQTVVISGQSNSKKRTRQFKKPVAKVNHQLSLKVHHQLASNQRNQKQKKLQNEVHNFSSFQLDQRPICTKGAYKFDEYNIANSQNQFLKQKVGGRQDQQNNTSSNEEVFLNKTRHQQKKKLEKRDKYDPRKAIEQAKKNKKKQVQIVNQQHKSLSQDVQTEFKHQQDKNTPLINEERSKSKQRDKTVQKLPKKQQKLNKKDDNSKSIKSISATGNKVNSRSSQNVAPKIDCWGGQTSSGLSKKQQKIKIKAVVQKKQQNSYKSKFINQILKKKNELAKTQENEQTQEVQENINQYKLNYQRIRQREQMQKREVEKNEDEVNLQGRSFEGQKYQKYAKLIKQKNFIQKERQIVQKQAQKNMQRGRFSNMSQAHILKMKIQQEKQKSNHASRKQKYQYLNNNIKMIIDKKKTLESKQDHFERQQQRSHNNHQVQRNSQVVVIRPIQELQKVYDTQYFDRFENLKPKLQMLSATRQSQLHQMIPVIEQEGKFMKKIMKQHANIFWQQAKKLDSNFIEFIGRA